MPHSTANWHWKTKYVGPWAKEWFSKELAGASSEQGDSSVTVVRVTEVEGDVELGQRKSKLITIYDCRVVVEWNASGKDDTSIKGTCVIPEVSHENTLDGVSDYTYEYTKTTSKGDGKAVDALFDHVRKVLPTLLEAKFKAFPQALLETHGKDLTVVTDDTPNASGTATPVQPKAAPAPSSTKTSGKQTTVSVVNTATVTVSGRFMASADDLYSLLTDEKRIPMWSRAPAQSNPSPGGAFSLFSGGVTGKYVELDPPKKTVQEWRLTGGGWPDNHYGTLTTTFNQESDSTNVEFSLKGVPKGKEEEVERGLEGYYIRGLKSMGYVQVSHYEPSSPLRTSKPVASQQKSIDWKGFAAFAIAGLVLVASILPAFMGAGRR